MKFADVKNDVAFRKIFGNQKKTKILISFLNAILQLKGKERIKTVLIINPYQLPRIAGEKATIIDVRVTDQKGRHFIVEMQVTEPDGFDKRVQYYVCRDYSMQIQRGDDYPELKPSIFIGILNFKYFKTKDYLSNHLILNGKTYEHELKDIKFCFIELTKFKKKEKELTTLTDKWIYFIKNAGKLEMVPENVDDEGLKEAYRDADMHTWSKDELIDYDNIYIREQDERGWKLKVVYDIVRKMLAKNVAVEEIAEMTSVPVEKVLELKEELDD